MQCALLDHAIKRLQILPIVKSKEKCLQPECLQIYSRQSEIKQNTFGQEKKEEKWKFLKIC